MKKLLLLLLLPIFVQAQTNVTVRRNATTKMVTTYLNPNTMDTLVAYSGGLTDDYILQWDNSIKRAVWINPTSIIPVITTTTISPTATTNGISVSGSQIRLHAVSDSTGGVLTAGIDTIGGDKYFADQIWITENQQHGGHIGIVSGSGSLMAPLLGSASETSTYWMQILAHPAPNLYNTNPTDGIIFQVYDNEGPDPITAGNAFNFKNGTTSVFNIDFAGDGNLWGGLNMFDNRVSNGAISIGSASGSLLAPNFGANSESATAWINFTGQPATNVDNTNPTDAFKFSAYKSNDGSQALTGGNLVNFFNKDVSKFSVDYNGVITSAGLTNGLVKSTSGALSNATAGTDYTLLNGTGIVEMAGTTPSYLSSTGSGNIVKATSPTLTTPNIGNATGGTLSLSGLLTSTQGNNTQIFNSATATTGYQFGRMTNTSSGLLWGIEGSAAGTLLTGGSAYGGVLTTSTSTNLELGTNQVKAITIDGTTQDVTIANNITASNLLSGTSTPTLTGVSNVASSSANAGRYFRIGKNVTVFGHISVTPTSTTTNTSIRLSLPIGATLGSTTILSGSGSARSGGDTPVFVIADTVNNEALLYFTSTDTSAHGIEYSYSYTMP